MEEHVYIHYTNWKGVTSTRVICPGRLFLGTTEYHPEPQWLLEAHDIEKNELRTFAMKDVHRWWTDKR